MPTRTETRTDGEPPFGWLFNTASSANTFLSHTQTLDQYGESTRAEDDGRAAAAKDEGENGSPVNGGCERVGDHGRPFSGGARDRQLREGSDDGMMGVVPYLWERRKHSWLRAARRLGPALLPHRVPFRQTRQRAETQDSIQSDSLTGKLAKA